MAANSYSPEVFKSIGHEQLKAYPASQSHGPFRATQLWNDIIQYLKEHVVCKRRRMKMRTFENCFTGCEAVDKVLERLTQLRDTFTSIISREKACKVCQLMIEERIFEPIGSKRRCTECRFEDSSTRFYRITDSNAVQLERNDTMTNEDDSTSLDVVAEAGPLSRTDSPGKEHGDEEGNIDLSLCNDSIDSSCGNSSMVSSLCRSSTSSSSVSSRRHNNSRIAQEIMDITGSWKRYSSECLRRSSISLSRRSGVSGGGVSIFKSCPLLPGMAEEEDAAARPPLKEVVMGGGNPLQPGAEDEIWREIALSQLLTMVDIPVLDPILSYDPAAAASSSQDNMAFSNLAFRRVESISSLFTDKHDQWLETATDCLECLPQGFDLLDKSLSEQTELTQKLRMYQSIVDYYRHQKESLLPSSFADMHVALLNLLMQGRRDMVLRCVQLSLLLLPICLRLEVTRLLLFMKVASEDALKLTATEDTNRQVIEKSFTPALLQHKVLNPHQCGQLILFMMDQANKVTDCPADVEELVMARIEEITIGMMPPIQETTFCSRVGPAEYHKQQKECTQSSMIELMNVIIDNTKLSLKEKKQKLKQFKNTYPELYEEHFVDIKW